MSYDSRILNQLPRRIRDTFHFRLSHHSGITTSLFASLRSSLNQGMGPKQFSNLPVELHLRRHDQKAIAYREAARDLRHVVGQTFEPFGEYEDASRACGFVPSDGNDA